jgi:protein required for attachment to host cells
MPHPTDTSLPHLQSVHRRWFVVADGGTARFLATSKDRTKLEVLREVAAPGVHLKTHDIVSDRPGRSFESASPTRHGIAAKNDPHEMAKERFIAEVAELLCQENEAGRFDELVLIVTRAQAATLQEALDPATRARVRETLTKDLTKEPVHALYDRLIADGLLPPRPAIPA